MKRFWYKVRTKLIRLLAGKDVSIVSNVTISGVLYPRGNWAMITCNFIMGKYGYSDRP